MMKSAVWCAAIAIVGQAVLAGSAVAEVGAPQNWQTGLQVAVTPLAEMAQSFYDYVTIIIIGITLFVLGLMAYVIVRFREKANPEPARFTHNTTIEVLWTVIPIFILIAIGIPSFNLLFKQYEYPPPEVTIKSVGNAWFWEHEYPDQDGLTVTQNMITDADILKANIGDDKYNEAYGDLEGLELLRATYRDSQQYWASYPAQRQLAVDNPIAVPINKVVHVLVTSNDVIHGWAMPAFGSRTQAVPGRTTATWFKATKTGAFYGQCSVLCGTRHAFMPMEIHVVEEDTYNQWLALMKDDKDVEARKLLYDALPKRGEQNVALRQPTAANEN
ncbi:MAG: cytochrome c oxidase subunit II [Pseudomonadota bacterium]